jgi:hypothetical protein
MPQASCFIVPRAIAQGPIAQSTCGNYAGVKLIEFVTHLLLPGGISGYDLLLL